MQEERTGLNRLFSPTPHQAPNGLQLLDKLLRHRLTIERWVLARRRGES